MQQKAKLFLVQKTCIYLPNSSYLPACLLAPSPIFYDDFYKEYDSNYITTQEDLVQVKLAAIEVRKPTIGEVTISESGAFGFYKELEGHQVIQRDVNGRKMYYRYDNRKHFPLIGYISPINKQFRDHFGKNIVHNMNDILVNIPTNGSTIKIIDLITFI